MIEASIENANELDSFYRRDFEKLPGDVQARMHPRRKAALRAAAVQYCGAAGLSTLISMPAVCCALVALVRRCARSEKLATIATYEQLCEGEMFSFSTMRKAVRLARQYGWIRVVYEREARDPANPKAVPLNKPNLFALLAPLRRLVDVVLGRHERNVPGYKRNNNPYTLSPTSNHKGFGGSQKGSRQSRGEIAPGAQGRLGRPPHPPRQPKGPRLSGQGSVRGSVGLGEAKVSEIYSPLKTRTLPDLLQLTERGFDVLQIERSGAAITQETAIETARAFVATDRVPLTLADFDRALASRNPVWCVLALIETTIKAATHNRHPIRDFAAYWGKITFRPNVEADPVESVARTIDGHARAASGFTDAPVPDGNFPPDDADLPDYPPRVILPQALRSVMFRAAGAWQLLRPEERANMLARRTPFSPGERNFAKLEKSLRAILATLPDSLQPAGRIWLDHYQTRRDASPFPDPPEILKEDQGVKRIA